MSLDVNNMLTSFRAYMESNVTEYDALDTATKDALDAAMPQAIFEAVITEFTTNGKVSFAVGDFSGTDSGGDTPDNIEASDGSIS